MSTLLNSSANLRAELHFFRLHKLFPDRIKEVLMQRRVETDDDLVCVIFKNGHKVVRPEEETTSDEFMALCGMLYDLPNGSDA